VINNAGILRGTSLLKAPLAEIRDELETNLFGIVQFVANT
jgi:NAD(P)-dependent dehydrogenase (short-subunit alcohol dehydrogenase family)